MATTAPPSPVKATPPAAGTLVPRCGSHVLPCRWAAERTFARISKHRPTARDCERLP